MSQGILYRPENFDSTKKYPLIFDYYERRSDELHEFLLPDFCTARIDIPYFVSNGYLVFVPDIYYRQGHNGEGACNAVLSAARYLSQFPWVDSTRIGLQGHSFGGWETSYLITHATLFRAACEVAGVSDQVSGYDELQGNRGTSRQDLYEGNSQGASYGYGVTPWTAPSLYMGNSPVFFADRVTTPLLIMHGDADHKVPFEQSVEWYLALHRAGKKVWFLQYQKEDHVLSRYADKLDFTVRMKQYFDYYLKGSPPPKWMTVGVPAYEKGAETGLELDRSGRLP
jgi:dipeptidyl aminopeptidase/acylaminoacyl peptidase